MIVEYPKFSKLEIKHKASIENFVSRFDTYSDFNFTSLFCWDVNSTCGVSYLNENLVIKMPDYITGKVVYSILGNNEIDASVAELLKITPCLELVPEITAKTIVSPKFTIIEDRDNFDYVYLISSLVSLNGKKNKVKRNKTNKFFKNFQENLRLQNIKFRSGEHKKIIEEIFRSWATERNRNDDEVKNELLAIKRLLLYAPELNLTGFLVYIDGDYVGFTINEIIDEDNAICHFQKAMLEYEHLDVFISQLSAKELSHFGIKYVNWEQDLGIEGLRRLKSSYPVYKFLKKYRVSATESLN